MNQFTMRCFADRNCAEFVEPLSKRSGEAWWHVLHNNHRNRQVRRVAKTKDTVIMNQRAGTTASTGLRVALLLACFLMLAVAGWVLGKWPARWTSTIAAILIAALGLAIPLYQPKDTTLTWNPYSQQALTQARAAGHPVFIDFTAAWCLSCQVNERLVLKSADVQHQFSKNNVTLLRADWTQYDPAITQQLASINRSGVPTYVIYPAPVNSTPDVLPELLTKDIVLTALEKDTKK